MAADRLRVVLDTNIVISSLWGGHPAKIMDYWKTGSFELLITDPILKEYLAVLARFRLSDAELQEHGLLFLDSPFATLVHPHETITAISADATDNRFLECAVEGRAGYIVSGDHHLLALERFRGIPIVNARAFLGAMEKQIP